MHLIRAWLASYLVLMLGCGTPGSQPKPLEKTVNPPSVGATASLSGCEVAALPVDGDDRFYGGGLFAPKRKATGTGDLCDIADDNLTAAEDAILALPKPTSGEIRHAWDRRRVPNRLALVTRRFRLSGEERKHLERDGFVVGALLQQPSYAAAYHEIYQSQLPVFISADSILHTVYAAHDEIVAQIEKRELAPKLSALLSMLHCQLPSAATRYPPAIARDLDLYLVVSRSLLAGKPVPSMLGNADIEGEAAKLVAMAERASGMQSVSLFGRDRVIDFSQYQPRGHYTKQRRLELYFKATMWLSRVEFNIVSRSSRSSAPGEVPDQRETPHEATLALALADLVAVAKQSAELERFEQVFATFAGRREDIPLPKLAELAKQAGIVDLHSPDVAAKLRAAVGDTFQRTARIHYMPPGTPVLPAIATFIGPRVVSDTVAMRPLADSETPARQHIRGGDIAYLLGHDRGREFIADDLKRFPELGKNLVKARALLAGAPRTDSFYTLWLDAVRGLSRKPAGVMPSFMDTTAFSDFRINSAIAAFAQLRHNHTLIAGQAYGTGGCQIPDGYLEPAPNVYDALVRYATLGLAQSAHLGPGAADARVYFARLGKIAHVLSAISQIELANQPLPPPAQRYLAMVSEMLPYGSDGRPTYTGWYFDLFYKSADAIANSELIADCFTSGNGLVSYFGASAPLLGIFIVDTGGPPRAMVGPVAHAYDHQDNRVPRLDDKAAALLSTADRHAPWMANYSVAAPPESSFQASYEWSEGSFTVRIEAKQALGQMTIEVLDHHRLPIGSATRQIGKGKTLVKIPYKTVQNIEMLAFKTARFTGWAELKCTENGCSPIVFGEFRKQLDKPDTSSE